MEYRGFFATALVAYACLAAGSAAQADDSAASGDSRLADSVSSVETVTVTAERREGRNVDTPVSVFAASGQQLADQGVNSLQDLQNVVPGVHMDAVGLAFQPTIRGVGSAISGPGDTSNVATYVDGFYRPSMNSNNMQFNDIDSVQVLKGPQGTLFGRNATGGAILVTTADPSMTDFSANGGLSYASYNTFRADASIGGPLNDSNNLAASLTAYYTSSDGWAKDVVTGASEAPSNDWGVRAKILFNPTGQLSFTLTYEHNQIDDPTFIAYNAYHGWSDAALTPGVVVESKPDRTSMDVIPVNKVQNDALYLKGVYDLGWATLTSYTSGSHETAFNQLDEDASLEPIAAANWPIYEDTITQELDLASEGDGPFKWVSGLYYYNDNEVYKSLNVSVSGSPFFEAFKNAGQRTSSVAAFFDGTYNFWDNLYLTIGARYSYDHLFEGYTLVGVLDGHHAAALGSFKPRAVLRYQITPDSNIYISFNQGYKSAVYNVFGAADTPVKPENITAYELGYKVASSNWDFSTALFYYDYKDLQINTYIAYTSELVNAANSQIYGLEGNLTGRLTDNLTLNLSGAYTHARYQNFPDDPSYTWNPAMGGVVVGTVPGNGLTMQRVPEFQFDVSLDYAHPLFGGELDLTGNYGFQTKVYLDPADVTDQPAYGVLNLRASWTDPDGRITYSIFGNNVTDKRYVTQVYATNSAFNQAWASPAIFGGEIKFKY